MQQMIARIANTIIEFKPIIVPAREIVSLNVDALGEVGGGIRCATQQMPVRSF